MKKKILFYSVMLTVIIPGACFAQEAPVQVPANYSSLVYPGPDGRLVYKPFTKKGDIIPDFSYCGYRRSEEPIPDVPVAVTLSPLPGEAVTNGTMACPEGPDSFPQIQAALDEVAAREPNTNGFRGAVLLKKGTYYVNGGLVLNSGVVLRGEGDGEDGTVLIFRNPQGTGILMGSEAVIERLEEVLQITDRYLPSGSMSVTVKDASGFKPDDMIHITKTVNDRWIKDLGMDDPGTRRDGGKVRAWTADAYRLQHVRRVMEVTENKISLDAPLPQSIDRQHGGGEVQKIDITGTKSLMGVEKLRIVSNYDTSVQSEVRADAPYLADEESNLAVGIKLTCVDSWVRNCTVMHAAFAAVAMNNSRYITVRDCKSLEPVSVIRGGKRYSFSNSDSSMTLVYNCYAEEGRHDYVTGSRDTGPIAFVKSGALRAHASSETHQRWATGVLFDCIEIKEGGGIAAANRGSAGSGQGWSGANVVIWNCKAPSIKVEDPPTSEQNFAIGCSATAPSDAKFHGMQGDGFIEKTGSPVKPDSLFVQQLIDRIGKEKAMQVLAEQN